MIEIIFYVLYGVNVFIFFKTKDEHEKILQFISMCFIVVMLFFIQIDNKVDKLQETLDKNNKVIEVVPADKNIKIGIKK